MLILRRMMLCALFGGLLMVCALSRPAFPAAPDVGDTVWDQLLRWHVRDGLVDYAGIQAESSQLEQYLEALAHTPQLWSSKAAELAFWINAYNACVMKGVLDHQPIRSVKDVKGFFDQMHYRVAGESLTLNQIEAKGRALGDWRMHMAVVCASSSCPPLRSEAYQTEHLDDQLAEQARDFLRDTRRGLRLDGDALWLSQVFKWYAQDFVPGRRPGLFQRLTVGDLLPVIQPYLEPRLADQIASRKPTIRFLDYDWSLNEQWVSHQAR